MSQLDISIFYSHLFALLLTFYIFSHFIVLVLSTYYFNDKLRNLESESESIKVENVNNVVTLMKILE